MQRSLRTLIGRKAQYGLDVTSGPKHLLRIAVRGIIAIIASGFHIKSTRMKARTYPIHRSWWSFRLDVGLGEQGHDLPTPAGPIAPLLRSEREKCASDCGKDESEEDSDEDESE